MASGKATWLGRMLAGLATLALFGVLLAAAAAESPEADPMAALAEGNQLFRDGQLEAAVEAYQRGWSPEVVHPTLVYNLATTLHHLERLPEAILWYRRAPDSGDPWLEENLWLARRTLGSQVLPAAGALGWLTRHRQGLRLVAIALAWLGLLALVVLPRVPVSVLVCVALLAVAAWTTAWTAGRWGPRPAVLLRDCRTTAGDLPAGTEAWVRPTPDGRWRVGGTNGAVCPAESLELVFPGA